MTNESELCKVKEESCGNVRVRLRGDDVVINKIIKYLRSMYEFVGYFGSDEWSGIWVSGKELVISRLSDGFISVCGWGGKGGAWIGVVMGVYDVSYVGTRCWTLGGFGGGSWESWGVSRNGRL